jgi:hypothetical protein
VSDETDDYADNGLPPAPRWLPSRRNATIFLLVAFATGCVHYWRNDWGVYTHIGNERIYKFDVPRWIAFPVSAGVGCVFGAVALILMAVGRAAWLRLAR